MTDARTPIFLNYHRQIADILKRQLQASAPKDIYRHCVRDLDLLYSSEYNSTTMKFDSVAFYHACGIALHEDHKTTKEGLPYRG